MNENNLIPFSERSVSEARESGAKGGKKSGEIRRKKRDMKAKMKMLLELPPCDNDRETLEALGVSPEDMDNEMVLLTAQFLKAAAGDAQSFDRVMAVLGKDIKHEELALKKKELRLKEQASKPAKDGANDGFIDALGSRTEDVWQE